MMKSLIAGQGFAVGADGVISPVRDARIEEDAEQVSGFRRSVGVPRPSRRLHEMLSEHGAEPGDRLGLD